MSFRRSLRLRNLDFSLSVEMTDVDTMTMETLMKKPNYLERKRQAILELGYEFVRFRSRAKKSLRSIKGMIQNNTCHFEGVHD